MLASIPKGLAGILIGFLTLLLLKASSLLSHYYLFGNKKGLEEPGLENALLLILCALVVAVPRKWQLFCAATLLLGTQLLAFLDLVYYRFFNDLPSLYLLPAWFQSGRASESVSSILNPQDALVLVPLLIFALLAYPLKAFRPEEERSLGLALLLFLSGIGFFAYTWNTMHPVRHQQLQRRFQNIAMARLFGPQFYHYYDLYEWSRVKLGAEGGVKFDKDLVLSVLQESRDQSTTDTPFKGRYAGRDLLFIQLESLEYFALDAEYEGKKIMPFLHRAKDSVFTFKLFDQTHLGRSADGQFMYLNSLHPPAHRPLPFTYPTNFYFGLPKLFAEAGYRSYYLEPCEPSFWNSGVLSKSYGFQERLYQDDLPAKDSRTDIRGWGLTDFALFDKVLEIGASSVDPYFMYVVTVMCHHPYAESSNIPVDFPPPKKTNMVRRYLRCAAARDRALQELVEKLAETERGRKTVLCLAGDHDANLPAAEMNHLGYPIFPEREVVPVMIGSVEEFLGHIPEGKKIDLPSDFGGQIDLAPSLGHVFSLAMEESVFVGGNLFATQIRGPYHCRLGTWMDQSGKIHQSEESGDGQESDRFRVSEMLLQGDKIGTFRSR